MFRLCLTHHQANVFIYKVAIDMQCQLSCIYCGIQSLELARIILKCIVKFKCKLYCSKIVFKISLSLMHPFGYLLHSVTYSLCCPTYLFLISLVHCSVDPSELLIFNFRPPPLFFAS
jgi:hypothetical protein